jgi:hypothetical protein
VSGAALWLQVIDRATVTYRRRWALAPAVLAPQIGGPLVAHRRLESLSRWAEGLSCSRELLRAYRHLGLGRIAKSQLRSVRSLWISRTVSPT